MIYQHKATYELINIFSIIFRELSSIFLKIIIFNDGLATESTLRAAVVDLRSCVATELDSLLTFVQETASNIAKEEDYNGDPIMNTTPS